MPLQSFTHVTLIYTLPLQRDTAFIGSLWLDVMRQVTLSAVVFEKEEMVTGRADLGGAFLEGSDLNWARWLNRPRVRDRRVLLAQVMSFPGVTAVLWGNQSQVWFADTREVSLPAWYAPALSGQVTPHVTTFHERLDGQTSVHTATPSTGCSGTTHAHHCSDPEAFSRPKL